jgi:hypothetical protein
MDRKELKLLLRAEDIPTDYLDDVLRQHHDKKMWIAEALGLCSENDWKVEIPLPSDLESKKDVHEFLIALSELSEGKYTVLDLNFMWKGKNKVRVTKVIGEMWEEIKKLYTEQCEGQRYDWYRKITDFFSNLPIPVIFWDLDTSLPKVLCQYGDMVVNGRVGELSINPYDYFTLSGKGCTYTSCVRMGGEYFNTVLMYLASECTLVSYSKDIEGTKKVGRSLVYMNPDAVYFGRVYGSMANSDILLLRTYIHHKLGGIWVKRDAGLKITDYIQKGQGYIDVSYGVYTYRKETEPVKFIFPEGMCLECGGLIRDSNEQGKCEDCIYDNNSCSNCSDTIYDGGMCYDPSGDLVCQSCYDELAFYCQHCGNDRWINDGQYCVDERGGYWCESCVDAHAYQCAGCEDYFSNSNGDYVITDDEDTFCPNCADGETFFCVKCGVTRSRSAADNKNVEGETWCDDCYHGNSSECKECAERFSDDNLEDGICQVCYDLKESGDAYEKYRDVSGIEYCSGA